MNITKMISDTEISESKDDCGLIYIRNTYSDEADLWDKDDAIEVINHLLKVFEIDRFNDISKG